MLKERITWSNRVGRYRVINGTRSCNVSKCKSCPKLPNVADGITRPRRAKRNRLPRSARARLLAHIRHATEPVHCPLPFHSLLIHWTSNSAYIVANPLYCEKEPASAFTRRPVQFKRPVDPQQSTKTIPNAQSKETESIKNNIRTGYIKKK